MKEKTTSTNKFSFKKLLDAKKLIEKIEIKEKQAIFTVCPDHRDKYRKINKGFINLITKSPYLREKYTCPHLVDKPPILSFKAPHNPTSEQEVLNDLLTASQFELKFQKLLTDNKLILDITIEANQASIIVFPQYQEYYYKINKALSNLVKRSPTLTSQYLPPKINNEQPHLIFNSPFKPDNGQQVIRELFAAVYQKKRKKKINEFPFQMLLSSNQLVQSIQIQDGDKAVLTIFTQYRANYLQINRGLYHLVKSTPALQDLCLPPPQRRQQTYINLTPKAIALGLKGEDILASLIKASCKEYDLEQEECPILRGSARSIGETTLAKDQIDPKVCSKNENVKPHSPSSISLEFDEGYEVMSTSELNFNFENVDWNLVESESQSVENSEFSSPIATPLQETDAYLGVLEQLLFADEGTPLQENSTRTSLFIEEFDLQNNIEASFTTTQPSLLVQWKPPLFPPACFKERTKQDEYVSPHQSSQKCLS